MWLQNLLGVMNSNSEERNKSCLAWDYSNASGWLIPGHSMRRKEHLLQELPNEGNHSVHSTDLEQCVIRLGFEIFGYIDLSENYHIHQLEKWLDSLDRSDSKSFFSLPVLALRSPVKSCFGNLTSHLNLHPIHDIPRYSSVPSLAEPIRMLFTDHP